MEPQFTLDDHFELFMTLRKSVMKNLEQLLLFHLRSAKNKNGNVLCSYDKATFPRVFDCSLNLNNIRQCHG